MDKDVLMVLILAIVVGYWNNKAVNETTGQAGLILAGQQEILQQCKGD